MKKLFNNLVRRTTKYRTRDLKKEQKNPISNKTNKPASPGKFRHTTEIQHIQKTRYTNAKFRSAL